jgi:CopG antitoxin of type II toxin-antitoxin system
MMKDLRFLARESNVQEKKICLSKQLPKFESLDKLVEFPETHDTSEYWDQMPEVDFDVYLQTREFRD